jgi:hypothetical protein
MKQSHSNCVYCGLPSFGKGCRFGPRGIHVHPTPNKCMYCGLSAVGKGCRFAPNGIHVRFGDFGLIQKEQMSQGLVTGYLIEQLKKPITDHDAYTLGIIDFKGNQIKKPQNEQEENAFNVLEQFLINLKKSFKSQIEFAVDETRFNSTIKEGAFNKDHYSLKIDFKQSIEQLAKQLYNIIEQYKDQLTSIEIDQCVMEGFINANEQTNSKD